MGKRSNTPLEERDYGFIYLVLAGLLALTTFWAIVDMISFRAPWQKYQKRLNSAEYDSLQTELNDAESQLGSESGERLTNLKQQLREKEADLRGKAYDDLQADLENADLELRMAMQQYRFAKSEYDALWYEYKHAEHQGHQDVADRMRPKVDALNEEVSTLKTAWDNAEAKKMEIEERVARYNQEAQQLRLEIDALEKPIEDIKTTLSLVDNRKVAIEQFVLPNFVQGNFENYLDRVDRCTSCHVNTDKGGYDNYPPPFQTHPDRDLYLRTHPVNQFGCTPCHEGQGPALQSPDFAHGRVKYWEHPLLDQDFMEAGCNKCHGNEIYVDHAPRLSKAKRMVFDLGCYGCHEIASYDDRKIGPPLNDIIHKTSTEFLYSWTKNNKEIRPHTRMPNPMFTDEEAKAVTAYLVDIGKNSDYSLPKAPDGGSTERGEQLVSTLGCKGCHVITERDREIKQSDVSYDVAPDLRIAGSKLNRDWLFAWIKDPKQYHPNTTMPKLRLTDDEARDITAYLMTLKGWNSSNHTVRASDLASPELVAEGKAIIRNFGCHGCHEIQGMENEGKVSVSLNEFGAKTPEELFFGDAYANGSVPEETWEAWTMGKMQNSRLYQTEAVIQRMPSFALSDDDAVTMAVLLKSLDGRRIGLNYLHGMDRINVAKEKGRRLVRQYNCTGCHIIENQGGFIRPTIAEALGVSPGEAETFSPPNLISEGRKVQPDWLFEFLKNPVTQIRPWLNVRMPTFDFTDEEVNILIEYFQALEGMSEPFKEIEVPITQSQLRAAEILYSNNYLSCFSCHQVGRKKPEGPPSGWAPDFLLAPDRLNPDWVFDWIANPQAIQPGTRMPSFYPDAAPPNILDGDPNQQIHALTNYLINIRKYVNN